MKQQYLVGEKEKEFIRLYDGHYVMGSSDTKKGAEAVRKSIGRPELKIFKLVETKK